MKLVILWVVLIVLFIGFFHVFSGEPSAGAAAASADAPPSVFRNFSPLMLFWPAFFLLFWNFKRVAKKSSETAALMGRGKMLAALDALGPRGRFFPNIAFDYNRGLANFSLWRLDEAEQSFRFALGSNRASPLRRLAFPWLALTRAAAGNVESARATVGDAEREGHAGEPLLILAKAALSVRERAWAAAARLLLDPALSQLGGTSAALRDVLRGWCAVQDPEVGSVEVNQVALYGEASPDALRRYWPELADFVATGTAR